jgi:Glycosyl hydrolases family 35/Beta-galactosidase, domain 2
LQLPAESITRFGNAGHFAGKARGWSDDFYPRRESVLIFGTRSNEPKRRMFFLVLSLLSCSLSLAQTNSPQPSIGWDRQTFTIDGKDVVLIGGSMHYFRIPAEEWETDFERMQEDGFNLVDVYIPWFIHEPEEGKFDFDSLEKFLDLAHKHRIYVVARPGPYINSESDQGAFPRWLSGQDVGFRRNTDLDRKWSKHWYEAVMPVLAKNQVTRGGPVIMVQIENEYGHPQYLSDEEKKDYVRFLYQVASGYGFEVPLMANDMQFAQKDPADPTLSKIYGTVDAYFDSYQNLEEMLTNQRKLNSNSPLGCAEYGLAGAEATVRTMLGLGTDYLDQYLFRGGSQFSHAAKGYEFAGYSADAIVEEGGYTMPKYGPMKTAALFLRQFREILARAEPAPEPATVDDPEVWVRQRNNGGQGFLFVRSDIRGVSDRSLALRSTSEQHIRYVDPKTHGKRTIPAYSRLLLSREQTRLLPLNVPLNENSWLVYSTADLLGRYTYSHRTWLVLYGDPGQLGEASFHFTPKPDTLNANSIWNSQNQEAVFLFSFGDRDQVLPVTKNLSILLISRERAYRAKEFFVDGKPSLLVSSADDALFGLPQTKIVFHLQTRRALRDFTVLTESTLQGVTSGASPLAVLQVSGTQQFSANIPSANLSAPEVKVSLSNSWTGFQPTIQRKVSQLVSLPELEIWNKGITHYHAAFPARDRPLRLSFFADDYRAVYVNGKFAAEASNRAPQSLLLRPCATGPNCMIDIYYVDTGRPKEDLGLWRLDEKKGLASAAWLDGQDQTPVRTEWQLEFAGIDGLGHMPRGNAPITTLQYSFPRPSAGELTAVWRAFMPEIRGLVYLNGVYMEHHEPDRTPNIGRDGIYLPPSMLKSENTLLLVAFDPVPSKLSPAIRPEPDSIRRKAELVLNFVAP